MNILKTKIPPPIIALTCIVINYLSTYLINPIKFPNIEIIGILILLVGLITAMLAIFLFKKDKTTVNPDKSRGSYNFNYNWNFFYN